MKKVAGILGVCLSAAFLLSVQAGQTSSGASASKVKVQVDAGKPDDKGNQVFNIKIVIDPGWYVYANPVDHNNEFLNSNKTTLVITSKDKLESVKIDYPKGKIKNEDKQQFKIYQGTVTLQATVRRAQGTKAPVQGTLAINACNKDRCLERGEITFSIP
jgi:DsbC/DsbD-like thiol-disulfide interchange protein